MNFKDVVKKYWFIFLVAIGLVVFLGFYGVQQYKDRPISVSSKQDNGKFIVYSIDGENYYADDLYQDLSMNYGTTAAYFKWSMDVIDKSVETTDEITDFANRYMQTIQYYNDEDTINQYLIQYGYTNGIADLNKYAMDMAKGDVVYTDFYTRNFDTYAPYAIDDLAPKKISHILVKIATVNETTNDAGETVYEAVPTAEETAKLEAVKAAIASGQDFGEIAKQYSDDEGSAVNGGLVGINTATTASSNYVKPFADAVNDQDFDTISDEPVLSTYGYHFIKIDKPTNEELKANDVFLKEISSFYTYANIKALKEKSDELGFVIKNEELKKHIEDFIAMADDELETLKNKKLEAEEKEKEKENEAYLAETYEEPEYVEEGSEVIE